MELWMLCVLSQETHSSRGVQTQQLFWNATHSPESCTRKGNRGVWGFPQGGLTCEGDTQRGAEL